MGNSTVPTARTARAQFAEIASRPQPTGWKGGGTLAKALELVRSSGKDGGYEPVPQVCDSNHRNIGGDHDD